MLPSRLVRRHVTTITGALRNATPTVVDSDGRRWGMEEIKEGSRRVSSVLLKIAEDDIILHNALLLSRPGGGFVQGLIGVWEAGWCCAPLCTAHTTREMTYYMENSRASVLLYDGHNEEKAVELVGHCTTPIHLVKIESLGPGNGVFLNEKIEEKTPALMVYTSGTTGNPKGVVHSQKSVAKMVSVLLDAWRWTRHDVVVNCLPLHHLHGLLNVLTCSLAAGATCIFTSAKPSDLTQALFYSKDLVPTVFMAVPTIYANLLPKITPEVVAKQFRLMVSGSMSLPSPLKKKWEDATGIKLLERYGMTETGMMLSQGYDSERCVGTVGVPLEGVEVRLVDGEVQVKSDTVFSEYFDNPVATRSAFTKDGWFLTGDMASQCPTTGDYTILGRISTDIIKSSGFKLSALEIESALLLHPDIAEAAVLGVPDPVYGEVVTAVLSPASVDIGSVRKHCESCLAGYKAPRRYLTVPEIPRNTMGKVNKKELLKTLF